MIMIKKIIFYMFQIQPDLSIDKFIQSKNEEKSYSI